MTFQNWEDGKDFFKILNQTKKNFGPKSPNRRRLSAVNRVLFHLNVELLNAVYFQSPLLTFPVLWEDNLKVSGLYNDNISNTKNKIKWIPKIQTWKSVLISLCLTIFTIQVSAINQSGSNRFGTRRLLASLCVCVCVCVHLNPKDAEKAHCRQNLQLTQDLRIFHKIGVFVYVDWRISGSSVFARKKKNEWQLFSRWKKCSLKFQKFQFFFFHFFLMFYKIWNFFLQNTLSEKICVSVPSQGNFFLKMKQWLLT